MKKAAKIVRLVIPVADMYIFSKWMFVMVRAGTDTQAGGSLALMISIPGKFCINGR